MIPAWPRRPRLVAGNWKMNKAAAEGASLARELAAKARGGPPCAIAIFPPFTALESVARELRDGPLRLGGQNLHAEPRGAFTGEVAGSMLADLGCSMVIVGHSERRHGMGEDDGLVARKLRAAQRDGLTPIVCVGETLAEREAGRTDEVLERQVRGACDGLDAEAAAGLLIAYEPVWAIGTGRVATADQARTAHQVIRGALDAAAGASVGAATAVLYGGSVTAQNAASLFAEEELDGALVGGASLDAEGFWAIATAAGAAAPRR